MSMNNSCDNSDDECASQGYSSNQSINYSAQSQRQFGDLGRSRHGDSSAGGSKRHYSITDSLCEDGDESECGETKRKSRNLSEKKRRDQFNMLIHELLSMVSLSNRKMDKTTVLKTAIAFLKKQNELAAQLHAHEIKETWKPSFLTNDEFMRIMLDASSAFVLVITKVGNILYASENITSVMGYQAEDLINNSIFDYVYKDDIPMLYNQLTQHQLVESDDNIADYQRGENQVNLLFRMRQAISPPVYHLLSCQGCFRFWSNKDVLNTTGLPLKSTTCYCCVVQRSNPACMHELSYLDETKKEFTSRQSTEWKFLFLDHRGPLLIGYQPFEVLGNSMYDYIHPDDLEMLANSHKELSETGKSQSCYYRFLTKGEQWLWLKSSYYISYNQWNSKPEFIVCTNTVVSLTVAQAAQARRQQAQPLRQVTELSGCTSTVPHVKKSDVKPHTKGQTDNASAVSFVYSEADGNQPSSSTADPVPSTSKAVPTSVFGGQISLLEPMPSGQPMTTSSTLRKASLVKILSLPSSDSVTKVPTTVIKSSLLGGHSSQKMPTSGSVSVVGAPALSNQVLTVRQIHLTKAQELLFHQLKARYTSLLARLSKQQDELHGVVDMLNLSADTFLLPVSGQDQDHIHQLQVQDQQALQPHTVLEQSHDIMVQELGQHAVQEGRNTVMQGQHSEQQGHHTIQERQYTVVQQGQHMVQQEQNMVLQGQHLLQEGQHAGEQVLPGQSLLQHQGQELPGQPVIQQQGQLVMQQQTLRGQPGQQTSAGQVLQQQGQHMLQQQGQQIVQGHQTLTQHGQPTLRQRVIQQTLTQHGQQVVQQQEQETSQQQDLQEQLPQQRGQILPQPVTMVPVNIISPVAQNTNSQLIQIIPQQTRPGTPQNPFHFGQGTNVRIRDLLHQQPR